jgi:hypothetical protein
MSLAGVTPDYKAVNIKEVVNIIKKYLRSPVKAQAQERLTPTDKIEPVSQIDESLSEVAELEKQTDEQRPESEFQEPQAQPPEQKVVADRTEQLLSSILVQLKSMQRADMFSEFSIMRLMAGVVQILVLFCLLITIWFLMSPNRQDNWIFIALGFAVVLQLMALTFYIMQGRK